jgi:hypothetical protein
VASLHGPSSRHREETSPYIAAALPPTATRPGPYPRESATHRHFGSAKVRESFERYGFSPMQASQAYLGVEGDSVDFSMLDPSTSSAIFLCPVHSGRRA